MLPAFRELRQKRGLTQKQVADALQIKQQAVSKWEKFQYVCPSLELWQTLKLIRLLGVSLEELVDLTGEVVSKDILDLSQDLPEAIPNENQLISVIPKESVERVPISIRQRRGQPKFRKDLLEAYEYQCAITECDAEEALEAAHIVPYSKTEHNAICNGLLLRSDIHTLFDLNLIVVVPDDNYPKQNNSLIVYIAPSLRKTYYIQFHGNQIKHLPKSLIAYPDKNALLSRCNQCDWL